MKYYSLRRRAMAALMVPLSVAIVAILILATIVSYARISEMRNAEMHQDGAVIALLFAHEALESDQIGDVRGHNIPHHLLDGRVQFRIMSSENLVTKSEDMPVLAGQVETGLSQVRSNGQYWQVLRMSGGPDIWIDIAEPLSLRRSLTYSMVGSLALPLIVMAGALVVIFSLRVQSAIAPLERLSDDLARREADDLSPLGDTDAPEEVRALVNALNRLLERLQSVLTQEREFSDNAAHELRTPLAVLRLRAQLIERRLGEDPGMKRDMDEFDAALDRATKVIDDMLEIARLTSEHEVKRIFNLSTELDSVVAAFSPLPQARHIAFTAAIEPDIWVSGISGALERAAYNILENALKFTPEGGSIHVSFSRENGHARFSVRDTGPGIRPGEEELIFTRFWRADKSSAGAGLGLALVRRVAILHGGAAGAQREENGEGLIVFFEVPIARAMSQME